MPTPPRNQTNLVQISYQSSSLNVPPELLSQSNDNDITEQQEHIVEKSDVDMNGNSNHHPQWHTSDFNQTQATLSSIENPKYNLPEQKDSEEDYTGL